MPFASYRISCADGVRIHAWLIHAPVENWRQAPTILFFHGNAGNIGLRLPNALQMIQFLSANVLLVEYRGYGDSDSVPPSESGLKLDAEAALRFAQQHADIDSSQLFLFGRSLGGSVALHLADYAIRHHIPLAGVMVENTFTSISSMVDQLMPFLTWIKPFVLRIGWDSAALVPNLTTIPLLFLAGARDELVPHSHMRDLYQAAVLHRADPGNESKPNPLVRMHIIPDGTHNESWLQGGSAYWDAIRDFMAAALLLTPPPQSEQPRKGGGGGRTSTTTTSSGSSSAHRTNAAASSSVQSSIPIMPSSFVDIVKDATGVGSTARAAPKGLPKKEL